MKPNFGPAEGNSAPTGHDVEDDASSDEEFLRKETSQYGRGWAICALEFEEPNALRH